METKSLLIGLGGFILGGLVVSIAATSLPKPATPTSMTMTEMSDSLKGKTGDDFDKAFITGMIEHHQGAIDMANLAKANAGHDEIKKMADDIVAAQSKEINMMRTWQKDWGYQAAVQNHNGTGH
jgi:uncharacterized protein (DUF305 family)